MTILGNPLITSIGLILTIIALSLSIWQLIKANKQTSVLTNIKKSITTRYIDEFPYYFPQIISMLAEAKTSIVIACDLPCYASFSDRINWIDYKHILETKAHKSISINMLYYNESLRNFLLMEQYSEIRTNWDIWKDDINNKNKVLQYLKSMNSKATINSFRFTDFLELLEKENTETIKTFSNHIKMQEIDTNMPIFFWIIDGKQAIFAIPSNSKNFKTYGFITSDPRLIETFHTIIKGFYSE